MKSRKLIVLAFSLVLLILFGALTYRNLSDNYVPSPVPDIVSFGESPEDPKPEETVERAPNFTVEDEEGKEVHLSDFRGKNVVLNFWASWCPPCRAEMPFYDAAFSERGEEIVFLMIDLTDGSRETKEIARQFVDEHGYSFPIYYDTQRNGAMAYGVNSIPLTVLIDRDGGLVTKHLGSLSEDALKELLDQFDSF